MAATPKSWKRYAKGNARALRLDRFAAGDPANGFPASRAQCPSFIRRESS